MGQSSCRLLWVFLWALSVAVRVSVSRWMTRSDVSSVGRRTLLDLLQPAKGVCPWVSRRTEDVTSSDTEACEGSASIKLETNSRLWKQLCRGTCDAPYRLPFNPSLQSTNTIGTEPGISERSGGRVGQPRSAACRVVQGRG